MQIISRNDLRLNALYSCGSLWKIIIRVDGKTIVSETITLLYRAEALKRANDLIFLAGITESAEVIVEKIKKRRQIA